MTSPYIQRDASHAASAEGIAPELPSGSPGRVERSLAAVAMVLLTAMVLMFTLHNWPLTAAAPLGWRLKVMSSDILIGGSMAFGCGWVAFGPRRWRWAGWWIVVGTLGAVFVWGHLPTAS